ncbi:MAG: RNA polymerase subunit sigma [Sandaracinaceae bacterium]|nr:RNA polymerase subunit sigma [Sandaracinaceae bacterium]
MTQSATQARLEQLIDRGLATPGPIVFLTGAGISAESGIPTFRGQEGYWTVGSTNYHPQEMATHAAFERMPEEVWRWYLYRRGVCRKAEPNVAHQALVRLERALVERGQGDRFLLVTQNVDGLHLRAGNTIERTYTIHGDIDRMRCDADDPPGTRPVPPEIGEHWTASVPSKRRAPPKEAAPEARIVPKERAARSAAGRAEQLSTPFDDGTRALLTCPCGAWMRPHVLWFDESYDEEHFRFESSIRAATSAALLVVVGTSGQTNLPMQIGGIVARRGAPMIVINQDESPFSDFVKHGLTGLFLQGPAGEHVPAVVERLVARG